MAHYVAIIKGNEFFIPKNKKFQIVKNINQMFTKTKTKTTKRSRKLSDNNNNNNNNNNNRNDTIINLFTRNKIKHIPHKYKTIIATNKIVKNNNNISNNNNNNNSENNRYCYIKILSNIKTDPENSFGGWGPGADFWIKGIIITTTLQ